ncbi:MAG: DegT/DnrJ/EryC1/StrS family aminotransferase [Candidatus Tectomicrobia bacterium]|uniref:DegT/DnrJ/EryC1/StrS family aminotransferase n=1 Tax=Tectimicrobiota bacterium TaxID=2528274 RepID=A0A932HX80_UNCTE|nr:DegT/DnrJ/EryC1/StrS family aminotransferase [Candidatus Tectomicrobia bacterium]
MSQKLALLGGEPVRREPYPVHSTMIGEEEEREVLEVLRSQHLSGFSGTFTDRFLGGEKVQAIERAFADLFGVRHAVSVNSATSALHCAVAATGVEPGEEIITSPYTMSATASSILMENAIPVFADVEDETFCIDPASVEACITPRTRAILTVNIFGHPSALHELRAIADKHGLMLLEDNAQAPLAACRGRMAGTVGEIGIQSLNYHKVIQTGEGGIALTDDPEMALHMQLKRNHGEVVAGPMGREDLPNMVGFNYRLTEVCAAIGLGQMKKLRRLTDIRARLAARLTQQLREFDFLTPPAVAEGCTHVYYLYTMKFDEAKAGIPRGLFARALRAEGVNVLEGYLRPIYMEPIYQKRSAYGTRGFPFRQGSWESPVSYREGACPTVERLWKREALVTNICRHPNTEREVEEFVQAVDKVRRNLDELRGMA